MKKNTAFGACVLIISYLFILQEAKAETSFYDINTIQKIEINFNEDNWDYLLDTAKMGSDGYTMAKWIKINGTQYDSVGVKFKGNSSFDSTYKKNPFNIALDQYKSQNYEGIKTIKLANCFDDPSMIREVLSYDIAEKYMDCPRANYAQVYINGNYIGLYSNTETINKQFCSDRFYSSSNTFISCTPMIKPGPTVKSNLKFISGDSSAYFDFYEMKSKYGWNDLAALCDSVTNHPETIGNIMDMDRVLWMLAFDNVLVNVDSYIGAFSQNHYLYKDNTGHYNAIIWDLNMSLGGFPHIGNSNSSMGSLSIAELEKLPLTMHSTDPYWPLINIVMNNSTYKKMYMAHARTIANENFVSDNYLTEAGQLQALIDKAVQSDGNKFFSYTQFQEGLTTDINVGSYDVPGIQNLMSKRIEYLQSLPEFSYTLPAITDISISNDKPVMNDNVTIIVSVTNAKQNAVELGLRFDKKKKFSRFLMYDDGQHGDGEANDNVFGASFVMAGMEAQYYLYAENDNAGLFSPERAEHEFYSLKATVPTAKPGEVVINEFLAKNSKDTSNELGSYEDWIELYNNTNDSLNLFGLYLTDDYTNPTKFAFPENTIIKAKSYLPIWADEGESTSTSLHCNFKLSASGEQLMLSDGNGTVLDSITFGAQTADVSIGRCPNGTGDFTASTEPSFGSENICVTGIREIISSTGDGYIFPNPAEDFIQLPDEMLNGLEIIIYSNLGIKLYQGMPAGKIDVRGFSPGIYFMRVNNKILSFVKI